MAAFDEAPAQSLRLLSSILSCRSYADLGECLLEPLSRHLGASSSVFLQFLQLEKESFRTGQYSYRGPEPDSLETYLNQGLFAADPCVSLSVADGQPNNEGAKIVHLSRINGWRGGNYEANFLVPHGLVDVVGVVVPVRSALEASTMCIGFHRLHDDPEFQVAQAARLRFLMPALESVLTNLAYSESLTLSGTVLDVIAQTGNDTGFVVLDDDLTVRHANRLGLQHLNLLSDDRQKAVVVRSEAFGDIRERLLHSIDRGIPCGHFTLRPSDIDVDVSSFEGPGGQAYYLIVTSNNGNAPRFAKACKQHGLSRREVDIASLLCAGQSNPSIAFELGISLRTVENHLRSIYAKTQVCSRTQLISKIAFAKPSTMSSVATSSH